MHQRDVHYPVIHDSVGDYNTLPIRLDAPAIHQDCNNAPVATRFTSTGDTAKFSLRHGMKRRTANMLNAFPFQIPF